MFPKGISELDINKLIGQNVARKGMIAIKFENWFDVDF